MTSHNENAPCMSGNSAEGEVRNPNREVKERTMKSKPIMPQATVSREGRFEVKPDTLLMEILCNADNSSSVIDRSRYIITAVTA